MSPSNIEAIGGKRWETILKQILSKILAWLKANNSNYGIVQKKKKKTNWKFFYPNIDFRCGNNHTIEIEFMEQSNNNTFGHPKGTTER